MVVRGSNNNKKKSGIPRFGWVGGKGSWNNKVVTKRPITKDKKKSYYDKKCMGFSYKWRLFHLWSLSLVPHTSALLFVGFLNEYFIYFVP